MTWSIHMLKILVHCGLFAQNDNYANVNGVKLYYETLGEGQPLVLLHYLTEVFFIRVKR